MISFSPDFFLFSLGVSEILRAPCCHIDADERDLLKRTALVYTAD
jgi:hypothetical protein